MSSFNSLQQQMPKKYDDNDLKSTNCQQNSHQENYFHSSDSQRCHFTSMEANSDGDRFFASSPIKFPKQKWNDVNELIKNSTILSPISVTDGLCDNSNNKKKHKGDRTLSENDLDKIMANNILLRPPKSTMSNEELFSAIYKSKRKLNIKDNVESGPVDNAKISHSNVCLDQAQSRHSWSPESSYYLPNSVSRIKQIIVIWRLFYLTEQADDFLSGM
ncbi:hypothetical protein PV325_003786 [Microctonus aethiopoides]|nr:hypothetical protein PV325_003786 [Microctonus aethiopoides]